MSGYIVCGRSDYETPLAHLGIVQAADDAAAGEQAQLHYNVGLVEMVLVPEEAAHWVVRAGDEAGSEAP